MIYRWKWQSPCKFVEIKTCPGETTKRTMTIRAICGSCENPSGDDANQLVAAETAIGGVSIDDHTHSIMNANAACVHRHHKLVFGCNNNIITLSCAHATTTDDARKISEIAIMTISRETAWKNKNEITMIYTNDTRSTLTYRIYFYRPANTT